MDAATIGGIIRAILAAVGGMLVAKGYTDEATAQAAAGAAVTIAVAIWSAISKRKTPPAT